MPSELTCEVVKITHLLKHDNADTLQITHVYSYPVIVKQGDFEVGDLAVYFPVEAVLPEKDIFSFVWKGKEDPTEKNRMIRAIKLRGVFSMGLLMPFSKILEVYPELNPDDWSVGQNIANALGVVKYEPPEPMCLGGENERHPGWFVHYTDIENIRKYHGVLIPGEEVILTEKIHGANTRVCWYEDRLWVGSHNHCKRLGGDDIWNQVAKKLSLEEKLQKYPGLIFFGEVYGQIQKGYDYGLPKTSDFIVFDIYDLTKGRYLDYDDMCHIVDEIGLVRVPEILRGQWTKFEDFEPFADGDTVQGNGEHTREGFVLRPAKERFDDKLGRVVVKLHGQDFLTGKRKK